MGCGVACAAVGAEQGWNPGLPAYKAHTPTEPQPCATFNQTQQDS